MILRVYSLDLDCLWGWRLERWWGFKMGILKPVGVVLRDLCFGGRVSWVSWVLELMQLK